MKKLLNVTWTYSFRKKHRFKDSKTKERFFIKKPLWNMKKYQSRHEKQQSNLQKNQLTCSLVGSNCLNDNKVATPVTKRFFKKEENRDQKIIKLELKTFFTENSFRVFYCIRGPWEQLFFYSESKQILKHSWSCWNVGIAYY